MGFLRFVALLVLPFVLVARAVRYSVVAAFALLLFGVAGLTILWRYKKAYFFLAAIAYAGINFSAQQPIFLTAATLYMETFEFTYNELVVEPFNSIFECFSPIREWYNLTVAFAQTILAKIAEAFGLDLFTFTLVRNSQRADMRAPPLDDETRLLVEACQTALPATRSSSRAIQSLCDILEFVGGFIISLLGIFGDFLLVVIETTTDFFIDDNGDLDFSFPELFMTVAFTVVLDFVDPLGCFSPLSNLPWSLFVCLCPHRYDNLNDLPDPQWLAPIGCVCPINGESDPIRVLFSCFDGPILTFLLNVIQVLLNILQSLLSTASTVRGIIQNIFAEIINLKNRIEDLAGDIEDAICAIPIVDCRSVTVQEMQPGPMTARGVREMVLYNVTTLEITGDINRTVHYRRRADRNFLDPVLADIQRQTLHIERLERQIVSFPPVELPHFEFPGGNETPRADEFLMPSIHERVEAFKRYTHIGRNSVFGKLFMHHLEHLATRTSPALSGEEEAQRSFLRQGVPLLRLYMEAVAGLRTGPAPDMRWFADQIDARGIDVMAFAESSIASTREASGWGRQTQTRIVQSALRTRAVLVPDTLGDAVARTLARAPWMRATVHDTLRQIVDDARAARDAPPAAILEETAPTKDSRAIVIIGISLIGLGAAVFSIQIGLLALPVIAPFLAIILGVVAIFYFQVLSVVADVSGGILTTILSGGAIRSIDLLSPWTRLLGEFLLVGFERPYNNADIFSVVAQAREITRTEMEYIGLLFLHRFLCVVPRPGILDSCPPKPPFDPDTGLPTLGIIEWVEELLRADPTGQCNRVGDCAGLAKGCRCADGRLASDEAPCPALGRCETWPYMNGEGRLQEIDIQLDLQVDCEDLGWKFRDLGWWSATPRLEWWLLVNESGLRSLRYVTNSLSVGVAIPWYTLAIGLLGVLPIVNMLAKTTVWTTILLNIASLGTVTAATVVLEAISPLETAFPFDFVRDMLVFPNSAGGADKGSATSDENVCFVTCFPQFALALMLWLTVALIVFAGVAAPLLVAGYGVLRYVLFGWVDFAAEAGSMFFGAALEQYSKNVEARDAQEAPFLTGKPIHQARKPSGKKKM